MNCKVPPETTVIVDGERVTVTPGAVAPADAGTIVTSAVATAVGSATLAVCTITVCGDVTTGAVKRPEVEILPAFVDHFTAVLLLSRTYEVNCRVPPETTLVLDGERVIAATVTLPGLPTASDNSPRPLLPWLSSTEIANAFGFWTDVPEFEVTFSLTKRKRAAAATAGVLAVVGVPEIKPVFSSSVSPLGRLPSAMENW